LCSSCCAICPAGALAGLSAVWWQESTVARVYHLNSLCSIAVVWAAWRAGREATAKRLILTGLLAGLALANHLASVGAVLGAAALWIAARWRAYRDHGGTEGVAGWARTEWRLAAAGSAAVLPGLCLYLWLPLRYSQDPVVKWKPIVSLGDLGAYVLRSDYAARSWTAGSPVKTVHGLLHGLWVIGSELTPLGLGLAVAGAIVFRKRRPLLIGLAVWFLVFGLLFVTHGQRRDIFLWDRYWLPGMLAVTVLTGLGWQAVLARVPHAKARWAAVLALPLVLVGWNWERCDRSDHTLARDIAARLLERIKPNTFFVAHGDNVGFPVLYLLASKEMRPEGIRPYFPGMHPGRKMRLPPEAIQAGCVVWTHPPQWPADYRLQMDAIGLLGVGRMRQQAPWDPAPWDGWAVPSAENAPPRDQVYESHERELLSHYFTMKGRALARVHATAADAALLRAEHYAHLNEYSMLLLRDALHALGRPDWANRLHAETVAFAPLAVRQYTPPVEPTDDLPGDLPPGPGGPGSGR
jgi:hypothetical protein